MDADFTQMRSICFAQLRRIWSILGVGYREPLRPTANGTRNARRFSQIKFRSFLCVLCVSVVNSFASLARRVSLPSVGDEQLVLPGYRRGSYYTNAWPFRA